MSLARPMIVAHSVRRPGEEPVVTPPGDRGIVRRRGNGPFIHAVVLVDDACYAPKCMLGGYKLVNGCQERLRWRKPVPGPSRSNAGAGQGLAYASHSDVIMLVLVWYRTHGASGDGPYHYKIPKLETPSTQVIFRAGDGLPRREIDCSIYVGQLYGYFVVNSACAVYHGLGTRFRRR